MTEQNEQQPKPKAPLSKDDEELRGEGIRALRAERERADALDKELKKLQAAEKKRQEAEMSEAQREKARADELQARLEARDKADARKALLDTVSKETGVPAHLLSGDDEATLRENAKELAAWTETVAGPKTPSPIDTLGGSEASGTMTGEAEALSVLGFGQSSE